MNSSKPILETQRLQLRPLSLTDAEDIVRIYQNPVVMTFAGGVAPKEKIQERLANYIRFFNRDGFGVMAAIEKQTHKLIGVMGFFPQSVDGQEELEVVYLLDEPFWHMGYATEGVKTLIQYGFDVLKRKRLISLIDPLNTPSIHVAKRAGMSFDKEINYRGLQTLVFAI